MCKHVFCVETAKEITDRTAFTKCMYMYTTCRCIYTCTLCTGMCRSPAYLWSHVCGFTTSQNKKCLHHLLSLHVYMVVYMYTYMYMYMYYTTHTHIHTHTSKKLHCGFTSRKHSRWLWNQNSLMHSYHVESKMIYSATTHCETGTHAPQN